MPRSLPRLLFPPYWACPRFFAVVCPGAATLFLSGENDFCAALLVAFAFAALMGWPSCFVVDSPAVPAALQGGMRTLAQLVMLASRLSWWIGGLIFIAAWPAAFVFGCVDGLGPRLS